MQRDEQFEQLILRYNQLKKGALTVREMIDAEDFDGAINLIKSRKLMFADCKYIRTYLEMNDEQEKIADTLIEEIRMFEQQNIDRLTEKMKVVGAELSRVQASVKLQTAYSSDENAKGSIINIEE